MDFGSPEGDKSVNMEFHISKEGVVTILNGKVVASLEEFQNGIKTNLPGPGRFPPGGIIEAKAVCEFIVKEEPGEKINYFLPIHQDKNIEELRNSMSEKEYQRRILGNWDLPEAIIGGVRGGKKDRIKSRKGPKTKR